MVQSPETRRMDETKMKQIKLITLKHKPKEQTTTECLYSISTTCYAVVTNASALHKATRLIINIATAALTHTQKNPPQQNCNASAAVQEDGDFIQHLCCCFS